MSRRSTSRPLLTGLFAATLLVASACGSSGPDEGSSGTTSTSSGAASDNSADAATEAPEVVASTTWVGAVAKLAGATEITVIAPTSVQHPPDYEPTASDLAAITDADYVLYAGFEGFAPRMEEAAGSDAEVVTVTPEYDPEALSATVMELATMWGTTDVAEENLAEYTADYDAASAELRETTADRPQTVVAQMFVAGWAAFAGYEPVGTYGPEPTTASQVAELTGLSPTLVFENSHMGGGAEIASSSGAALVDLVNFPGEDLELMPVVEENAETIAAAVTG